MSASGKSETARGALREIIEVWRPFYGRLCLGIVLSMAALAAGLGLMALAGGRLSGAAIGLGAGLYLLRGFGVGRIALRYGERLFTHDVTFRALASLRVWFFRHLAAGAAAGLGFRRTGDLLTRLVSDIETLDNLYLRIAIPVAGAFLCLPVLAWFGLKLGVLVGICLTGLFLLGAFVVPVLVAREARRNGGVLLHAEAGLRNAALDFSSGLREARAFSAEAMLVDRIDRKQGALFQAQSALARRMALAGGASYLIGQLAVIIVLLAIAGIGFPHAGAIAGISVLFLVIAVFESISGLTRTGVLSGQVGHAAQRIVEIARQSGDSRGMQAVPARMDLVLENVTFRWQLDRPPVFENLSLIIPSGARIGVIGPSGAGKSSLAALLLKAAVPEAGTIRLGGVDIDTIEDGQLRSAMSWLSQHTHLFADTIRHNLTLGQPHVPDEALWQALDRAAIGDVIRDLPDGLDTWIGEGGASLSGGQGRRIALARALLSDAPIVILDEPATGLDADTERAFMQTLNETTQGRTVILIAHRLTGVERLDQVWRLHDHVLTPERI